MFQDSFWDRIHVYSDRAVLKLGTYDGSPPCEFQGFLNISMGAARFEENVGETAEEFLKETMRKPWGKLWRNLEGNFEEVLGETMWKSCGEAFKILLGNIWGQLRWFLRSLPQEVFKVPPKMFSKIPNEYPKFPLDIFNVPHRISSQFPRKRFQRFLQDWVSPWCSGRRHSQVCSHTQLVNGSCPWVISQQILTYKINSYVRLLFVKYLTY